MTAAATPSHTADSLDVEAALDLLSQEVARIGADSFDVLALESESLSLELFERRVKGSEISHSRGLGVRLFRVACPGYAFTERFTRAAILQTVRDAWSHSYLTDPVDIELPAPAPLPDLDLHTYDPTVMECGFETMKAFCLQLEELAWAADGRIDNVPYLSAGRSARQVWIRNQRGVDYSTRSASVSAGIGVTAKSGEQKKMGSFSRAGRRFEFQAEEIASRAAERAVELLGAEPIPSGALPVVLSNRVAPQFIGMFASSFYADSVHKGQSRLADKLGQTIGSSQVQLWSDPHLVEWPGSYLFDSEGVPSRPLQVIDRGVLVTYLHNLESARKDRVAPTGNGARSYAGKAGTGFANFVIPRGERTLADLLAAHPRCFYVVKLEGGSGCSSVSGEISIGAQGFLVEHGQCVRPVDRVTLSGNFFELLPQIEAFSDSWSDSFSSVKVPDTLIASLSVAG